MANPSTQFKKGNNGAKTRVQIGDRRTKITKAMLKCVSLEDVADFMTILMTLIKKEGRGQLKAMEIFLKLVAILPKQEIEQIVSPTYTIVPNPVDINKIQAEDDADE